MQAIKIRQNKRKNPSKRGKQAKFEACIRDFLRIQTRFCYPLSLFNNSLAPKKRRLGSVSLRRVHKFHNLTALLSTA